MSDRNGLESAEPSYTSTAGHCDVIHIPGIGEPVSRSHPGESDVEREQNDVAHGYARGSSLRKPVGESNKSNQRARQPVAGSQANEALLHRPLANRREEVRYVEAEHRGMARVKAVSPVSALPSDACGAGMGSYPPYQPPKCPLLGKLEPKRRDSKPPRLPACRRQRSLAVFSGPSFQDGIKLRFSQPTHPRKILEGHPHQGA